MSFEPALFEYGIHTEASDVRAHVSVVGRSIYAFRTRHGLDAIARLHPATASAWQPGVSGRTAEGWLVPPNEIADCRRLRFYSWPRWSAFSDDLSTSEKGRLAVECVVESMRAGRFPFWILASEDERREVQVKGTDIVVFCKQRVQVKCDWRCGDGPGATGNLFLQRAERNPLGMH